jgi:hypothetical protein
MRPTASDSSRRVRFSSTVAAALVVTAVTATAAIFALRAGGIAGGTSSSGSSAKLSPSDYKTLPAYFEQNRGQTDPRVQFMSHGPGYTVFLTGAGTVLALRKMTVAPGASARAAGGPAGKGIKITTASVWLNLRGARSDPQVEGIDPLPGRVNYFIGNDPGKWHTGIPTYARVRYRSVYPGIDLVYYGTPQALEYDLIAAPGANPDAIRIELQGADKTRLSAAGDLVISTAAGDLTMRKPRVYQESADGGRRLVNASYRVTGAGSKRIVALALAEHDSRLALVIDPELVYSSYLGGKGDRSGPIQGFAGLPPQIASLMFSDAAIDLALGPKNTVLITGLAYSSKFPTTPGAFQPTDQSSSTTPNAFVAKFDTTMSGAASLVYSTYLGGSGCNSALCAPGRDGDQANGVAVDTSGDAYVAGLTYSPNFPNPTCGAFGHANNQGAANINNGFVSELNPTGSGLIYSCFIHGSEGAPASSIAIKPGCASNCAAYVVGNTTSQATTGGKADFPILNARQATNPDTHGNSAGYLTVVNGGGGSLMYSTYLGGTGTSTGGEALTRVEADSGGTAFLTGGTFSSDFPLQNPFQSSNLAFSIGAENAVVARIDPAKSGNASLLYSTYLGGHGLSITFPITFAFGDIAAGVALDSSNHVYVAGVTASADFPTNGIKPPFQAHNKSVAVNAFITELDTTQTTPAKQLIYSTYLGGSGSLFPFRPGDAATDLTVDSATGKIFVTGAASSADFPTMNTCTQMMNVNGEADAFVTILDPNKPAATQLDFSTYLGGSAIDAATAIARDSTNLVYVAGGTFSGDFPVTKNAFQFGNNAFAAGHTNAFVTKLDTSSTVCPTPFPSPIITATSTSKATATPTATATTKPTATATKKPTPTATATLAPGQPHINSIPGIIVVGDPAGFDIMGTGFTPGSVVNFFVSTSKGPKKEGTFTPRSPHNSTMMTVVVPDTISLGQGFASLEVINTDTGFKVSNTAFALLQGNPLAGIPTLKTINGMGLAATSSDPNFATDNVETVVLQGTTVKLGGTGFDTANGVAVDIFCACPPTGKITMFFNKGDPRLTSTQIMYPLPVKGLPGSPPTGPASFRVSNKGTAAPFYAKQSNAVSVPIGARIHVLSVGQVGPLITVNGTGFSTLTVINFFNTMPGGMVENLGGLMPDGHPKIPLTFIDENKFTFIKPAGANPGASYVQALNPPFVPFTSSGNDPGGAFTLK